MQMTGRCFCVMGSTPASSYGHERMHAVRAPPPRAPGHAQERLLRSHTAHTGGLRTGEAYALHGERAQSAASSCGSCVRVSSNAPALYFSAATAVSASPQLCRARGCQMRHVRAVYKLRGGAPRPPTPDHVRPAGGAELTAPGGVRGRGWRGATRCRTPHTRPRTGPLVRLAPSGSSSSSPLAAWQVTCRSAEVGCNRRP